jgi:hypothetical protein
MKYRITFCNRPETGDNMARFGIDWFQYQGAVPPTLDHNFSKIRKKTSPHFSYMFLVVVIYHIPFCKGAETRENMARFEVDWFQYQDVVPPTLIHNFSKIRKKTSPHF